MLAGALIVVAAFVASRVHYAQRGVRFDASPISYFAQLIDPVLLRDQLLRSVGHLHAQPPLYNLVTGIALKLAPEAPEKLLSPLYTAAGLYAGLCLYVLLLRLDVPVVLGAAGAALTVASSAFVLYENWSFYPHLNVAWLLGAAAWLAQSRGRPGPALVVAAAHLVGLSLTRSLFHPVYVVIVAGLVTRLASPGLKRRTLLCFAAPGVLLLAWCLKNQVLFGFAGTSSWGSRNVHHAVVTLVGAVRVQAEVRRGQLTPAIDTTWFEPGDKIVRTFKLPPAPTGVPALDNVNKKTSSLFPTNFNHWSYPKSSRFYTADVKHLLATYPRAYLRALWERSVPLFYQPVDADAFFTTARAPIAKQAQRFDRVETGKPVRVAFAVGLLLALGWALRRATPRGERVVLVFALFTIAWVTAVGLVGEFGENHRFRYKIMWLGYAVAAAAHVATLRQLLHGLESALARRRARSVSASAR